MDVPADDVYLMAFSWIVKAAKGCARVDHGRSVDGLDSLGMLDYELDLVYGLFRSLVFCASDYVDVGAVRIVGNLGHVEFHDVENLLPSLTLDKLK